MTSRHKVKQQRGEACLEYMHLKVNVEFAVITLVMNSTIHGCVSSNGVSPHIFYYVYYIYILPMTDTK